MLEEDDMEPFVEELLSFVEGKKVALFGSYDWGDGEWMRDWVERMSNAGAIIITEKGMICQNEPDSEAIGDCIELGKEIASS